MTRQPGYSDAVNHAFAFAAKHHDRQVRKGTKLPYLTHQANVAVILTRYGCDEKTVVAGILHDVVEDCVRDGYTGQMLEQRIGEKFGEDVLETVLAVTHRRLDDTGTELSGEDKKLDYLKRLERASESALWVCAADKLHNAHSVLSDLRRTMDPNSIQVNRRRRRPVRNLLTFRYGWNWHPVVDFLSGRTTNRGIPVVDLSFLARLLW